MVTIAVAQRAAIQPVAQDHAELLAEMGLICQALVKIIEREKTGVRDGEGFWLGGDPILSHTQRLLGLVEQHRVYAGIK